MRNDSGPGHWGVGVELHRLDAPMEESIERADRRTMSGEWTASPVTGAHFEKWAAIFQRPDDEESRRAASTTFSSGEAATAPPPHCGPASSLSPTKTRAGTSASSTPPSTDRPQRLLHVNTGTKTVQFPAGTIPGYQAAPGWDPVPGWEASMCKHLSRYSPATPAPEAAVDTRSAMASPGFG
jgi:hypothetical protein